MKSSKNGAKTKNVSRSRNGREKKMRVASMKRKDARSGSLVANKSSKSAKRRSASVNKSL